MPVEVEETPDWVRDAVAASVADRQASGENRASDDFAALASAPYRPADAMAFARQFCAKPCPCGDDFSGPNAGDCTHFIAHVLYAGGVTLNGGYLSRCKAGLTTWAPTLMEKMEKAAATYSNVYVVPPHALQAGDFGVFRNPQGQPWHALMLASGLANPLHPGGQYRALTLQHSGYRCGKDWVEADFLNGRWYRIVVGP